jgi:hypothetical protein
MMLRCCLIVLMLLSGRAAAMQPSAACVEAAGVAERTWMLPTDLIRAIGQVESGHYGRETGRVPAWPWTVNANGSGYWFGSVGEAVAFVKSLQAHGVRLIDVGCFQVDLFYHPAAFASLEQAFDPAANADYAARFLTVLHERTGSWPAAIAGYHSGLASEGESYRQKVMVQLGSGQLGSGQLGSGQLGSGQLGMGGVAVTSHFRAPVGETITHQRAQDRYVILMSAAARAIRIIGP